MNGCRSIQELLPWYVNGSLSDEEARRVAGHLSHCETCRDELAQVMRLNMEVRRAYEGLEGMTTEIRTNVLRQTAGSNLARVDVGSFLLGFSFGASYRKGRIPMQGDIKLLGRRIRLISPSEEVHDG
jgi:anti-sigma factor RsiW